MSAAFSFGPLGAMTDLVVAPAVQVDNGRELKTVTTSRGVRWAQRARRNPRTWTVTRPWQDPQFARLLSLAASGLGGDMYLYDRACARQNMLPARLSVGDGVPVSVAEPAVQLGAVTWDTTQVPVLAGRTYTVSATLANQSAWLVLSGATTGGITKDYPTYSFTPTADGMLGIERKGTMTAVRVHEGLPDGRFLTSPGTPCKVAVADPEQVYQLVTDQETRIDYQVTLYEVGDTGTI